MAIAGNTLKMRKVIQDLLDEEVTPIQIYEIFLAALADYKNK